MKIKFIFSFTTEILKLFKLKSWKIYVNIKISICKVIDAK